MGSKRKKRGRSSLQLTDKRHPVSGMIAVLLAMVSVILFIALCFISSESHGNAGIFVGLAGIFCFLLSVAAFVLAWAALRRENIRPVFPTIAALISGLSVVFYMVLYILGNLM